ncbi:response regulator transcription factor [Acutalibacter muris]|uniref:Stage 0 sporulation protein A homolog n=1 Tax=Acutalibacter muris TaxID=1796620 RepID=A0A1Z2XRN0_9FIRM|nr:LytTR family DNA-binding domain-containing protein [Acutalibacter muris]ANU55637.1 DNA-binding response regulator [Hungateiclostridiaceae bacterium KB18]ASB41122.1 DNA-binding response regulator [Acutalibacter muris]QQR30395.1 response regulator transcription factor [Acutalibacter muris]
MTKIAIVDDNEVILNEVEDLTKKYMETASHSFQIKAYTKSLALISSIIDGDRFDIYVLDVDMPGSNGMDVAEVIRKVQPLAIIIFLTSYLEYATKGYTVKALRYILKNRMAEDLPEALETALTSLAKADKLCFLVSHYSNVTRVPYNDIIYVRKSYRSLQIVTTEQGSLSDNRGIKELFESINDPRFVFTDRSCFINLDFARAIDGNWMVMKNRERLPISRPMMPKVKEAIMRLWGGK